MKLSEAIRLGAMTTEPGRNHELFGRQGGTICRACVLGAAAVAVGITDGMFIQRLHEGNLGALGDRFPLLSAPVEIPGIGVTSSIGQAMNYLFEVSKWTREEIAGWIATLEHAQELVVENGNPAAIETAVAIPSAARS